jgi:ferredoxin
MTRGFSVRVDNTGEVFACRADQNVLLGMEVLGRRGIPVGCRGGGCGVCKVRVTAGEYEVRKMSRACVSAEEEAAGVVLACKLFPRSDLSLEVIGKMVKALDAAPCSSSDSASRAATG